MKFSEDIREKAARICDAASVSREKSAQPYGMTAKEIGLDVQINGEGECVGGADEQAVEVASVAWCLVPKEHNSRDPRRDTDAAKMLRDGWGRTQEQPS